jgi:anaerobic C4-dicarboxylate transporter
MGKQNFHITGIPTSLEPKRNDGSRIAAINFDLQYMLNHSFMMTGLVVTSVAVITGIALARVIF